MDDYTESWTQYRRVRNLFWLLFAGYVPVVGVAAVLCLKLFHTVMPGFPVAMIWMAGWAITGVRLNTWPCARCGKWFASTWWYNLSFFARKCVHCGLPKYAWTG
jgi:hypothetical protein